MAQVKALKSPLTLSRLCLRSFVEGLKPKSDISRTGVTTLLPLPSLTTTWRFEFMPTTLVAEVLNEMGMVPAYRGHVMQELLKLQVLDKLLRYERTRANVFMCLTLGKALLPNFVKKFPEIFSVYWNERLDRSRASYPELVNFGLRLGSLLTETGWVIQAVQIFTDVLEKIRLMKQGERTICDELDCLQRRLHCEAMMWDFDSCQITLDELMKELSQLDYERVPQSLFVEIYTRATEFELARHKYEDAQKFSAYAMQHLCDSMPKSILVDALRTAAKLCMATHDYEPGCILIKQAISIAENVFGRHHLKFADVMFDYAYFLLIFDRLERAIDIYVEVYNIRLLKLSDESFLMSLTSAALANAFFIRRHRSLNIIEQSLSVMTKMLPMKNLLLASTIRLRSLIAHKVSLCKYRRFHKTKKTHFNNYLSTQIEIVNLCVDMQGEMNLFTAKNYFELARIYQASKQYEDAKRSIAKCIVITKNEMSSSGKDAQDYRALKAYLKNTNAERDIVKEVRIEPWLLGKIEASNREMEEFAASSNTYEGLRNLYPPEKEFHEHLRALATAKGWDFSSQANNDFWCIEYIKERYFNVEESESKYESKYESECESESECVSECESEIISENVSELESQTETD